MWYNQGMEEYKPRAIYVFPAGTPEEERREQGNAKAIREAQKRASNRQKWDEVCEETKPGPLGKVVFGAFIVMCEILLLIMVYAIVPEPYKILALFIQLILFTRFTGASGRFR